MLQWDKPSAREVHVKEYGSRAFHLKGMRTLIDRPGVS
jgi:hypothetical protein